ncbi:hypothetical protein ACH495_19560 [Micromonospora sp. NPDC018662]|uniref:hypothetical protein n=1 Tax=Micromonospora sp. NPDC018662 TaxID=3364238 RepID=UPI0037929292
MPEEKSRRNRGPTARPIGPPVSPYRCPGRSPTGSARPAPLSAHRACGPAWVCDQCGRDWSCPTLRSAPTDAARRATLIPEFSRITRHAIRDLRGRVGGPDPVAIVRRFLWFLPLTDEEARAVALRLR